MYFVFIIIALGSGGNMLAKAHEVGYETRAECVEAIEKNITPVAAEIQKLSKGRDQITAATCATDDEIKVLLEHKDDKKV